MTRININGQSHEVDADPATPLLYVLRDDLALNGAKFGCGLGQCGSCTVLVEGEAVYSCLLPIAALGDRKVTTIEGLGTVDAPAPLQRAFMEEQAAQCGYCIAGMIMRAQALLQKTRSFSDAELRAHMQPNLCRCGTHARILRAVRRAAETMRAAELSAKHREAAR
jgi:aerobic-type carbon monoxide dehydrogenase small subunit (CoxS/CutS family)